MNRKEIVQFVTDGVALVGIMVALYLLFILSA
jgi:hypothetical protein